MDIEAIISEAQRIRSELLLNKELTCNIDPKRECIPVPKVGDGQIKLIIVGQDPTVKNAKSRDAIKTTLNLDKRNSLYNYLSAISERLGCNIEQNVYATNLLKCFYEVPPATIPNAVKEQTIYWIELLKKEIAQFPNAKIITLGEPVLEALVIAGSKKVREYWGYKGKNQADINNFYYCETSNNPLGRRIFPFPHQPSIRKEFYKRYIDDYIGFVNNI